MRYLSEEELEVAFRFLYLTSALGIMEKDIHNETSTLIIP